MIKVALNQAGPHDRTDEGKTPVSGHASMRMTPQSQLILLLLLQDTQREWYGLEMADRLALRRSVPGAILRRLYQAGWTTRRIEPESPITLKRARRLYYRLTDAGATEASECLANVWTTHLAKLAAVWDLSIDMVQRPNVGGST
jgi:PadR family transcriptional regulator PadR